MGKLSGDCAPVPGALWSCALVSVCCAVGAGADCGAGCCAGGLCAGGVVCCPCCGVWGVCAGGVVCWPGCCDWPLCCWLAGCVDCCGNPANVAGLRSEAA